LTLFLRSGDGLRTYFEHNGAAEGGCKRAVAYVLTVFAAHGALVSQEMASNFMDPFDFRTSIVYGWVTISKLGAPRRFNKNSYVYYRDYECDGTIV
jgi:hypothetical protein